MKSSKNETKTRSKARTSRSPGRAPSPSRSPARRSPGRPRKSPARKSPARKSPEYSPSKRAAAKLEKSPKVELKRVDRDTANGLRERKPAEAPPPPSARRPAKVGKSNYEAVLKLARSKELPRRTKPSVSDEESASEEETPVRVTRSGTRKLVTPQHVQEQVKTSRLERVLVGVQLPLVIVLIVAVNAVCSGQSCSFSDLSGASLKSLLSVGRWFKSPLAVLYCSFVAIVTLVSLLPCLGRRVTISASLGIGYVANGWFALLVCTVTAFSVNRLYYPVFEAISRDWLPLILPAEVLGLVIGICVFFAGRKVPEEARNEAGNTGVFLNDLLFGRVTNPVLFKRLNVKIVLFRIALISAILLNVAALHQGVSLKPLPPLTLQSLSKVETLKRLVASVSVDPTLLLVSSLQIVYFVHAVVSEANLLSTFEVQQEGTGLNLAVGYLLYPFTTPLISKYVLRSGITLSTVQLVIVLTVFLIGFYIYHASNSQKNAFRRNPFDPKLAHLDSLPTFQGNRLLISGWWGFLRHPNYLGDIILHLSLGLAVITAPPIIFIILTVIFLAHRTLRDDVRCRKRYGAAWDRYCSRVPYVLIPKIY